MGKNSSLEGREKGECYYKRSKKQTKQEESKRVWHSGMNYAKGKRMWSKVDRRRGHKFKCNCKVKNAQKNLR